MPAPMFLLGTLTAVATFAALLVLVAMMPAVPMTVAMLLVSTFGSGGIRSSSRSDGRKRPKSVASDHKLHVIAIVLHIEGSIGVLRDDLGALPLAALLEVAVHHGAHLPRAGVPRCLGGSSGRCCSSLLLVLLPLPRRRIVRRPEPRRCIERRPARRHVEWRPSETRGRHAWYSEAGRRAIEALAHALAHIEAWRALAHVEWGGEAWWTLLHIWRGRLVSARIG
mmetsp:Transcript_86287/g.227553  ORF Transcript_86287/g.227553 Transcript_86287/m.227553 type:complete len:224 (+) Transcript_86287:498-1169(+)